MNREFLKGLGLEDEQIENIMKEHGQTLQSVQAEVETLKNDKTTLQEQLNERDNDLKSFKAIKRKH